MLLLFTELLFDLLNFVLQKYEKNA